MWVERPRLAHTTSQGPLFPRGSHHHWHLLCTRAPTSRRCGHARRRSTPTPRGDAQHTQEPGPSCCVPFGDPHVHKVTPSGETRQGAATAAQTHWSQSTIWRGHTSLTSCCPCRGGLLRHPDNGNTRRGKGTPMIAASPLSGCPLAKPATQNLRWPSEGKGTTIGATVGIVMCQWGVAMVYRTSGHKGPSPQRHKPTKECQRIVPSSSQPLPDPLG